MKIERIKSSKTIAIRVTTKKGRKVYSRHAFRRKKRPDKDLESQINRLT